MSPLTAPFDRWRLQLGHELFTRVAGPKGYEARDRIHGTEGPRWFPPGAPIRRVHGDASSFVGGLSALLLQALHPAAMAGVAGHSGFRGDPWGRLARTSTFLAYTTFGTVEHAEDMIAKVRAVHERVRGKTPDGTPYRASDPHLLLWVHVAEAESFLRAYDRYGAHALTPDHADEYVRQSGMIATKLGATDVPQTVAELRATRDTFRPELTATDEALDTAHFLLREPPLPRGARLAYAPLVAGAVALLPRWARKELSLDRLTYRSVGRIGGALATRGVRWGLGNAESRAHQPMPPTIVPGA